MVETSETSGESSDWEVIQHPSYQSSSPPPPSPPSQGRLVDLELIIRDNFYDGGSSIFPPSEHEDLPLFREDSTSPTVMLPSQSPSSFACSDAGLPKEQQAKSDSRFLVVMNEIGTRMYTFGRRVFQVFLCSNSRCSSIVPAAVMVFALFACMKILQWRNRLLLLMKEKDQRISHLLHQISHMNEILSARRKVPVLQIN
ncbi:Coagulation factor XII [Bienertia sinuspersici]